MSACRGQSETELCYCEGDSLNCAILVQNVPLRRANSQSYNMQITDMDMVTSFDVKDSKSVDNKGLFTTNSRPHRVQESKQDVEREIPGPANMETPHLDSAAVEISTTGTLSSALTVSNSYLKFPKVSINGLKLLQDALKATSDRNGSDSDLSTRRSPFINNKSCKVTSLTSSVTRREDSQWTQESTDCFSAQNSIASTEDCKTPVVSSVSLERDGSVLTHKTLPCAGGVIEMSLIENSGFQTKSHELSESQLKLKNCCQQDINETDVGDAVKSSEGRPLIEDFNISDTEAVVCAPVDPFETFIFRYNGEATFRDQGAGDRERIRFEEGEKEVAFLVEKENPDVVTEMVPCSRINSEANLSSRGFVPEARYPGENTAAVTVSRMCPNSWDACECDTAVQQCELNADLKSDVSAKELSLKTGSLGDCSEVEGSDDKWHTCESCILDSNVSMKSSSFSREIARRELFGDFLKSDMAVKHNKRLEYSTDSILETSHSRFLEASKAGLAIVTETSVANQTVTVKACAQLLSGSTKRENCCSETPRTVGVMETTKNPFHGADGNSEFKVKEWSSGEKGCSQSMQGEVMSPVQEQDHERKFFQITDRVSSNKSLLIEQNYILNENGSRIKHPTVDVPSSSQCITMVGGNVTYDKASEHMESVIYSEDVPCLEQEESRDVLPNLAGKEKGWPTERPSSTKEKEQEIQFGSGEENDCFERPTLINEPKKSGSCSLIESVTVVRSTISEASANICLTTTINSPEQPTKTEVSQNVTGFRSASLSKSEKLSLKATKGSTKLVAKESRPQEQTVKTVYSQGGQAPEGSWPSDQTVSLEESQNFLGARIGSSVKTQNSCVHSLKGLKASKDSNPGRTVNEEGTIQTDGENNSTISETEQRSKRSANCNAEATRNSKHSANASMTTSF